MRSPVRPLGSRMADEHDAELARTLRRSSLRIVASGLALIATGVVILLTAPLHLLPTLELGWGLTAVGIVLSASGVWSWLRGRSAPSS